VHHRPSIFHSAFELERKCARFDARAEISEWPSPHVTPPDSVRGAGGDCCIEAKRPKGPASWLLADMAIKAVEAIRPVAIMGNRTLRAGVVAQIGDASERQNRVGCVRRDALKSIALPSG
jgi:hypothetical protein